MCLGQPAQANCSHPLCRVFSSTPKMKSILYVGDLLQTFKSFYKGRVSGSVFVKSKDISYLWQWCGLGLLVVSTKCLLEVMPLSSTLGGRRTCRCSRKGDARRKKNWAVTDFSWILPTNFRSINHLEPKPVTRVPSLQDGDWATCLSHTAVMAREVPPADCDEAETV